MPSPAFLIGMTNDYTVVPFFSLVYVLWRTSLQRICFVQSSKNSLSLPKICWQAFCVAILHEKDLKWPSNKIVSLFSKEKLKKIKDFLITVTCNFFCLISAGYIFKSYLCVRELHYLSRSFTFIIFFCVTFWRIRIRIII